jgi:type IV secretory pathway VirJ component
MYFFRGLITVCFFFTFFTSSAQSASDVSNLPLRVYPSSKKLDILLIYFTGDGGWNNFSQDLVAKMKSNGYPVIVFDSRKYFWNEKTPDKFSSDVQLTIDYYLAAWKLDKVAIVGYSFGADVAAFLPSHLHKGLIERILAMVLLSPSYSSDFEVKLADLIGSGTKVERKYNVQQAILKSPIKTLCIFGEDEDLYLKSALRESAIIEIKEVPGSHQFNNNMDLINELILARITK